MLALEPLRGAELTEFFEGILAEIDVVLPDDAIDDVRRRCGGNPLFAEELLRSAVDAHRLGRQPGASLPLSLHAVIRERLECCTAEERACSARPPCSAGHSGSISSERPSASMRSRRARA